MTKSEEILARKARYDRVERVADDLGRMIGVKRLKPSQDLKVQEMAPGLKGTTPITTENGETINVPSIFPLKIAASVVEIDGSPVAFAKTRAELDAVLDMLDEHGMSAAMEAFGKIHAPDEGAEVSDPKN